MCFKLACYNALHRLMRSCLLLQPKGKKRCELQMGNVPKRKDNSKYQNKSHPLSLPIRTLIWPNWTRLRVLCCAFVFLYARRTLSSKPSTKMQRVHPLSQSGSVFNSLYINHFSRQGLPMNGVCLNVQMNGISFKSSKTAVGAPHQAPFVQLCTGKRYFWLQAIIRVKEKQRLYAKFRIIQIKWLNTNHYICNPQIVLLLKENLILDSWLAYDQH